LEREITQIEIFEKKKTKGPKEDNQLRLSMSEGDDPHCLLIIITLLRNCK
jgi:hypothetical protein